MKTSSTLLLPTLSFLTLTHLLFAIPNQPGPQMAIRLIEDSCRRVSSFDSRVTLSYCVTAVNKAQFDKTAQMTPEQLASITMGLLDEQVSQTRAKIMALNGPAQQNPALKGALERCVASYNSATHKSESALKLFQKKDFKSADTKVSMIEGDGSNCEHQFAIHNVASPVTLENMDTEYLSEMSCLFIRFFANTYTLEGLHT